jgi:hypothetical protein
VLGAAIIVPPLSPPPPRRRGGAALELETAAGPDAGAAGSGCYAGATASRGSGLPCPEFKFIELYWRVVTVPVADSGQQPIRVGVSFFLQKKKALLFPSILLQHIPAELSHNKRYPRFRYA